MSRRASLFSKENPGKSRPKVRFPDELVFLDNVKENDTQAVNNMLRRASVQIDINGIGDSGMTPLHQACIEGNMAVVELLVNHGADVCKADADTWTPLHAACSEGFVQVARFLIDRGADKAKTTDQGERPIDLVESDDFPMIALMLSSDRETSLGSDQGSSLSSDKCSMLDAELCCSNDSDDQDCEGGILQAKYKLISATTSPIKPLGTTPGSPNSSRDIQIVNLNGRRLNALTP